MILLASNSAISQNISGSLSEHISSVEGKWNAIYKHIVLNEPDPERSVNRPNYEMEYSSDQRRALERSLLIRPIYLLTI